MALKFVVFRILDSKGQPLQGAQVSADSSNGAWGPLPTDREGYLFTHLAPGHYDVSVRHSTGHRELPVDIGECTVDNEGSGLIRIGLEHGGGGGGATLPLSTDGAFFRVGGERWTAVESTDFMLYLRYLRGEDITPVLAQRAGLGYNLLRVSLSCRQMFDLTPSDWHDYYAMLGPFIGLLASFGLRPEFVVFMDATYVFPTAMEQQRFYATVMAALLPYWQTILVELVNELDQPVNHLATDLSQVAGFISSHGSNGSQATPVRPWWAYETFHTNDAFEWWRKTGHNAMEFSSGAESLEGSGVPILANENTRPDHDGNVNHFYDAAAGAALLCAGSCFHSNNGKFSELFDAATLLFAQAWADGARSVPLEFQAGQYLRRDDLLTADLLRVYERRLSDGRGHIVSIRK